MFSLRTSPLFRAFAIIVFIFYGLPGHAQLSAAVHYEPKLLDTADFSTSLPDENRSPGVTTINNANLLENMETHLSSRQERKALMAYLKNISAGNNQINYNQSRVRLYYGLANMFARLRMYPLAMKCFFKTLEYKDRPESERETKSVEVTDPLRNNTKPELPDYKNAYLDLNAQDDSVFVNEPDPVGLNDKREIKSKAITYDRIINTFNDGKRAAAYALLFHVKQPVAGKGKVFKLSNTGHTFITLIKYNTDSTSVSISFGFYPHKDNLFSATPWDPSCSGTFKNDNGHKWDEVMGKFISKKRFDNILRLTKDYDGLEYHLSKNNCTDFALKAAGYAGFGVSNASGSWPLGHGNNPATTGQSIIKGETYDANDKANLFIDFDKKLIKN